MNNILVTASALSDQDLLARLETLAGKEREASVELIAHLAALDSRPALFLAQGYGSLFSYCTQALRLSEDAACNRIEAARACRRFPQILELLASGSLTLTSVRLLAPHLTPENHESVLQKARHRTRREIEALVAELAPRPDRPTRPGADLSRSLRPGTDTEARNPVVRSRHIPREFQRAVWRRDAGQCAFASPTGRRCTERTFLELHHKEPYAMHGPSTVANISLRCWRHNQYEAVLIFGPHGASIVPEAAPPD